MRELLNAIVEKVRKADLFEIGTCFGVFCLFIFLCFISPVMLVVEQVLKCQ